MHLHTITMCRKGLANMLCPQKQLNGCKIGRLFLLGFLLDIWILNATKIYQKQETTKESASINRRLTLQCVGIPEKVVSLQQWNVGLRERVIDVLIFTANVSTFGLRKSGVTSQLSRCGVCPLTSSQVFFCSPFGCGSWMVQECHDWMESVFCGFILWAVGDCSTEKKESSRVTKHLRVISWP